MRCVSCGTWRLDPAPPADELASLYPLNYEAHTREIKPAEPVIPGRTHALRRRYWEWVKANRPSIWGMPPRDAWRAAAAALFSMTRFGSYNPLAFGGEGKRLLDIGCATGGLMDDFLRMGWSVTGIDASEHAVRSARARGAKAVQGRFPEDKSVVKDAGPFSAVTMANVLEHLDDPLAALRAARELLEPGGTLLIWTPVCDGPLQRHLTPYWYNLDIPRHLHLFTKRGLAYLVRQAGFDPRVLRPATSARAVGRTLAAALDDAGWTAWAAAVQSRVFVRIAPNPAAAVLDVLGGGDVAVLMAVRVDDDRERR
ncbi:MAG: class I SAM-dependent methyltransferase [Deltaproteobacteria bacterium]|nr:class I SAM-dependent methyltransferase [Deltaproteobacteria bacterium]